MNVLWDKRVKLLMFFAASALCMTLVIPIRAELTFAQIPSILRIQNLSEFSLNPNVAPVVPNSLGQSFNPSVGSRGVIGEDDRLRMTNRSYPWSAIGRIIGITAEGKGYICTGTLITPNVVLTNAHCVVDFQTNELSQQISFEPNLINGRLRDDADVAKVTQVLPGSDFDDFSHLPNPDDWALLKLDKSLGETYGTIAWTPVPIDVLVDNPERFALVGYSFDVDNGETASVHMGCSILSEQEGVFYHNCDMQAGSSGGPILGQINDEIRIVAVNSTEEFERQTGQGIVNFATRIQQIVDRL
jgi:V8-like Glu-specific endopeptidase